MAMKQVDFTQAIKRLNVEIAKIKGKTTQGLIAAATFVKVKSQDRTPVDLGNLKASHYVTSGSANNKIIAEVGCTVNYAIYVHEQLAWQHKVGQAKFLQSAIDESTNEIVKIVSKRAKIA